MQKENDLLRRKVNELEMECFNLSYKHSEILNAKTTTKIDPKMKELLGSICHNVQKFMVAMKRL